MQIIYGCVGVDDASLELEVSKSAGTGGGGVSALGGGVTGSVEVDIAGVEDADGSVFVTVIIGVEVDVIKVLVATVIIVVEEIIGAIEDIINEDDAVEVATDTDSTAAAVTFSRSSNCFN